MHITIFFLGFKNAKKNKRLLKKLMWDRHVLRWIPLEERKEWHIYMIQLCFNSFNDGFVSSLSISLSLWITSSNLPTKRILQPLQKKELKQLPWNLLNPLKSLCFSTISHLHELQLLPPTFSKIVNSISMKTLTCIFFFNLSSMLRDHQGQKCLTFHIARHAVGSLLPS